MEFGLLPLYPSLPKCTTQDCCYNWWSTQRNRSENGASKKPKLKPFPRIDFVEQSEGKIY